MRWLSSVRGANVRSLIIFLHDHSDRLHVLALLESTLYYYYGAIRYLYRMSELVVRKARVICRSMNDRYGRLPYRKSLHPIANSEPKTHSHTFTSYVDLSLRFPKGIDGQGRNQLIADS